MRNFLFVFVILSSVKGFSNYSCSCTQDYSDSDGNRSSTTASVICPYGHLYEMDCSGMASGATVDATCRNINSGERTSDTEVHAAGGFPEGSPSCSVN